MQGAGDWDRICYLHTLQESRHDDKSHWNPEVSTSRFGGRDRNGLKAGRRGRRGEKEVEREK